MQRQLPPVENYLSVLLDVLKKNNISMMEDPDTSDLIENYTLKLNGRSPIGYIHTGELRLADIKFKIDNESDWHAWHKKNYPDHSLADALQFEVDKVVARVNLHHAGGDLFKVKDKSTVEHVDAQREESRLNIGKS